MIKQETITKITQNDDGTQSIDTTVKETAFNKDKEPDYIKIYTKMFCDFKNVPEKYTRLFLELTLRMSYCNSTDLAHSQLVNTGKPWSDSIMAACGWKTKDPYLKGLRTLCDCGAIKKVGRGVYQINPEYAGRGGWRYNPREDQGGIKDLVVTFNFKENKCDTNIVWADDGNDNEYNRFFRDMLSDNPGHVDTNKVSEAQLKRFKGVEDGKQRKTS